MPSHKERYNKAKKDSNALKERLLIKWEKRWKEEEGAEELNSFFELFKTTYQYALYGKKYNKAKNIDYKKMFLGIMAIGLVFYLFFCLKSLWLADDAALSLVKGGGSLLILVWLCSIVSKWVDIKKYQETWARHSWHLHAMNREMLKFICNIEPYDNGDRKVVFAKNILEIWDKNQEKFVHNMEEKEKGLMEAFSQISQWK